MSPCRLISIERIAPELKRELRNKRMNFTMKTQELTSVEEKDRSVDEMLSKHNSINSQISLQLKKELNTQETEFEKKMKQRRDRSVNRSMNKSIDRGVKSSEYFNEAFGSTKDLLSNIELNPHFRENKDNPFKN